MNVLLERRKFILKNLSYAWLSPSALSTINTAFQSDGLSVISATNLYLDNIAISNKLKANTIAWYINEDPMFVCSLGITPINMSIQMPWRGVVGNSNGYFETNYYFTNNTEIELVYSIKLANITKTLIGCWWGGWSASGTAFPGASNYLNGQLTANFNAGDATVKNINRYDQILIQKTNIDAKNLVLFADGSISSVNFDRTTKDFFISKYTLPILGGKCDSNTVVEKSDGMICKAVFRDIYSGNLELYPWVEQTKVGLIDILTGTFYLSSGTVDLTIGYKLPDGTPWAPNI